MTLLRARLTVLMGRLRTCHFSAIAQLATEEEAQPPVETIERVLADTQWTEVQLTVLEFHEQEHCECSRQSMRTLAHIHSCSGHRCDTPTLQSF